MLFDLIWAELLYPIDSYLELSGSLVTSVLMKRFKYTLREYNFHKETRHRLYWDCRECKALFILTARTNWLLSGFYLNSAEIIYIVMF